MQDVFGLMGADPQVTPYQYLAYHASSAVKYQVWDKPRNAAFVFIIAIGSGGGGGAGQTRVAGNNGTGGGGGASGATGRLLIPGIWCPDRLYITVGSGAGAGAAGASTQIGIGQNSSMTLLSVAGGNAGAAGGSGGAGGSAAGAVTAANGQMGLFLGVAPQAGANGGVNTTGADISAFVTHPITGGAGGAGTATTTPFNGGGLVPMDAFLSTIAGGTNPGGAGQAGYAIRDNLHGFLSFGGSGGASANNAVGGAGGAGAIGCGGAGGGAGTTGGAGGRGGNGLVFIAVLS